MSPELSRHEINNDYLRKALAWTELRLRRLARSKGCEALPPESPVMRETRALVASDDIDQQIDNTEKLLDQAASGDVRPYFVELVDRFGLTTFESEVLLLCLAVELETVVSDLCAKIQPHEPRRNPTFGLALALFDDPDSGAFAPASPLRRWRLVEINQPGAQPLIASALRADERVVNYSLGLEPLDDRLVAHVRRMELPEALRRLPKSQLRVLEAIQLELARAGQAASAPLIQLCGPDGMSKQAIACRAAASVGYELDRLSADDLPAQPADLETFSLLWHRECRLQRRALYLDLNDVDDSRPAEMVSQQINRFLSRNSGLVFLSTREPSARAGRPSVTFEVLKPTNEEQRSLWSRMLFDSGGELATALSSQFNLNAATILAVSEKARSAGNADGVDLKRRAWDACRAAVRPRLDNLAELVSPRAHMRDLILPKDVKRRLYRIVDQARLRAVVYDDWGLGRKISRGLGLSVLFAGESGTGKTMAAEALANRLHLDLMRIDLSAVVSKYIGETEKNLRRVFDAADDGGAILFFDEADALFGKRSDVKDSHDRYSNIEIDYLLQRMESYRGLAILATNMKKSLDIAFLRRLRFVIDFPFPAKTQRFWIWRRALPPVGDALDSPQVPIAELDYNRLAGLDLTGGSIRNVVLNSAFLAARRGGRVTMPLLLRAAKDEYVKLGRPISEADFAWTPPAEVMA
jgi:hypothetical protein